MQNSMRGLTDKVAIVTGAGGGIGSAISERLAEEGCHVALFDRDADRVRAAGEKVEAFGRRASTYVVDSTDYEAVKDAVASIETEQGGVDVLVNNAGFDRFANFLDTTPDDWESIIAVNLRGTLEVIRLGPRTDTEYQDRLSSIQKEVAAGSIARAPAAAAPRYRRGPDPSPAHRN